MKVAVGFKTHSGWAAAVAIKKSKEQYSVVDRRRIELVEPRDLSWAKQPYHAAEELETDEARELIKRAIKAVYAKTLKEVEALRKRLRDDGYQIATAALVYPNAMPDWTVAQILAVHFRMHQAEGVLFPEAIAAAIRSARIKLVKLPDKTLFDHSVKATGLSFQELNDLVAKLGKTVGPPWGKDQKSAALAAIVALGGFTK